MVFHKLFIIITIFYYLAKNLLYTKKNRALFDPKVPAICPWNIFPNSRDIWGNGV